MEKRTKIIAQIIFASAISLAIFISSIVFGRDEIDHDNYRSDKVGKDTIYWENTYIFVFVSNVVNIVTLLFYIRLLVHNLSEKQADDYKCMLYWIIGAFQCISFGCGCKAFYDNCHYYKCYNELVLYGFTVAYLHIYFVIVGLIACGIGLYLLKELLHCFCCPENFNKKCTRVNPDWNKHTCQVCKKFDEDSMKAKCGCYYHPECISQMRLQADSSDAKI